MGLGYMPFTFPTAKVLDYISAETGSDPTKWHREKVESLYLSYKDAVTQAGFSYYQKGIGTGLREYIMAQTGIESADVSTFLYSIYTMVQNGTLDSYYLTFQEATKPETVAKKVTAAMRPYEQYAKAAKWIAILGVVAIGAYVAWPLIHKLHKGK